MSFICAKIAVNRADGGTLQGFFWMGKEYKVVKIEKHWQEYGLPQGMSSERQAWLLRRHRNYFRVITDGGRHFEIYLDRGGQGHRQEWILGRKLLA